MNHRIFKERAVKTPTGGVLQRWVEIVGLGPGELK